MPIDSKQYDSAIDFIDDDAKFSRLVTNLSNNDDRVRLKAYELYEDMYHNRPENIRITIRGGADDEEDSIEIYMPSAKKCVEAINRYLGVNYTIIPDPAMTASADPNAQPNANLQETATAIEKLFKRNRVKSKFIQMKRYELIKGDALFHIYGDRTKREGMRICIDELKPEHYFPIENPVTGETTGCYIVDIINNPNNTIKTILMTNDVLVRRQTYLKMYDESGNATGQIMSDLALYEIGGWDERVLPDEDIKFVEQIVDPFFLPKEITQLPVYHWKNQAPPSSSFGMSVLAGSETIINALNQSMSDEDLTLIMQGLGVYWSDASPPLNDRGEEEEWEISPRSVVQVASGGTFGRVSGISSIQPFGDHIGSLNEGLMQGLGLSDIAVGDVSDSTIAESGISRALKFAPLLSANAEKELDLIDICDQFIFDIVHGWLPAYEDVDSEGVEFVTSFDDPMPKDKSKQLADLIQLWTTASGILPVAWFYEQLNDIMGYHLDYNTDFAAALADAQKIMESTLPPPPPVPPGGNNSGGSGGKVGASSNGKAK